MPFNYRNTLAYQPLSQATIQGASTSPFEIAGKAMTGLENAMDNRIFNREIQGANTLDALNSLRVPQTKEAMAQFQQKQGLLTGINDARQQQQLFGLNRDTLGETIRHNMVSEQPKPFTPKGYDTATNPLTGAIEIYNKDTGLFGLGKQGVASGDVPISSKTPTISLPNGTTVYADYSGNPILKNGQPIVKDYSKFGLDVPSTVANEQATVDSLTKLDEAVTARPEAIGSVGTGLLNYIQNNINDFLKIPTDDRLARNKIAATAGVLSANIRSMYENGVMTEPDFERYKKLVPNENDSVEEYKSKLKILKADMVQNYTSKAKAQGTPAPRIPADAVTRPSRTIGTETRYWDGTSWVK